MTPHEMAQGFMEFLAEYHYHGERICSGAYGVAALRVRGNDGFVDIILYNDIIEVQAISYRNPSYSIIRLEDPRSFDQLLDFLQQNLRH
jgi:hypothetical protein